MTTTTKASCKCGATIETVYSHEMREWLNRHDKCLIPTPVQTPINYEDWKYNPMTGQKLWE